MWGGRVLGLGFGISVFGVIADEEGDAVVDNEGEVEGREGFRAWAELGLGEVPEEVGVGGEFFGAMFLPEEEGSDVEVEGEG